MTWRTGFRRKEPSDCKCKHPRIAHYTKDGHCVFPGCACEQFKAGGLAQFQNKRATCQYGHAHDSGTEIKACFDFHCEKLAGKIKGFQAQKVIDLIGPSGAKITTYKVDFIVEHLDGTTEFVEAKGDHIRNLQPWPIKWALLQDMHKGDRRFRFRVIRG